MSAKNYYVIDTSSLIELKKFPDDVFPGLWKNIEALIAEGFMISHKEVLKELSYQDDTLKKWAQKQKKFFKELDAYQIKIVKEILKKYPSLAKSESESPSADPFVIALAIELEDIHRRRWIHLLKNELLYLRNVYEARE